MVCPIAKALTCNDFRGIAISPIISKVFGYMLLIVIRNFLAVQITSLDFEKD